MKSPALILAALLAALPAHACLWDRDTLAAEARGHLDVLSTVLGDFPQPSRRFYEMRAERVQQEIEAAPDRAPAALYDDLAVALDQTGDATAAIGWMEKKSAAIARLTDPKAKAEQEYRRLANLGTFHAHRWFRNAARDTDLADLHAAIAKIGEAIALNPNAHFGREKYQLLALEWYRDGRTQDTARQLVTFLPPKLEPAEAEAAIKGICGIIQLGNAWENPDLFVALWFATRAAKHASLGVLVEARLLQLIELKRSSLHPALAENPWAAAGEAFHKLLPPERYWPVENEKLPALAQFYAAARRVTAANQTVRDAFAEERFAEDRHPDTDPKFWQGAPKPAKLPPMPGERRK
ncbi:MAG: hypothetical protein JSR82_02860 [Verrucomicrobia bacterium]|nr:hypothetical protein [Verrucomicrobiota bacterium]